MGTLPKSIALPKLLKLSGSPDEIFDPPSQRAIRNANPLAAYWVPSVAITGTIFNFPTVNPLIAPHNDAMKIVAINAIGSGTPCLLKLAKKIPEKARILPTDRSKFVVNIRRFAAEPIIIITATFKSTLVIFCVVKNVGDIIVNRTIMPIIIPTRTNFCK